VSAAAQTAMDSGVPDSADSIALRTKGPFQTMLVATVLVVTWVLNDVFVDRKLATGGHDDITNVAMRIFVVALEMGAMARRFPHAVFAVGGDAKLWGADKAFDFYATAARIGLILTGRNVATGACDRESMQDHRRGDGWHYCGSSTSEAGNAMTACLMRDTQYAMMIAHGARTLPRNYSATEMGRALRTADASGRCLWAKDANRIGDATADISPPRWLGGRRGVHPPVEWCAAYMRDVAR
jgi:hypothetical protein